MSRLHGFSSKTKRLIAARAGYRCSIPSCNQLTIGPGQHSLDFTVTGDAAHIYPASSKGPRGSEFPAIEASATANGIWLCKRCHGLVDANRGADFASKILLNYKALHEARIRREMAGDMTRIGWFHEFILHQSPIFEPGERLEFGKVTLLLGKNSSGKTALCEWLAGTADEAPRIRWQSSIQALDLEVKYSDPEKRAVRFQLDAEGSSQFTIDGRPYPNCAVPIRFVMVKEPPLSNAAETDDLDLIGMQLGLTRERVLSLLPRVNAASNQVARDFRVETNDGFTRVYADVQGAHMPLSFRLLSHSQQTLVLFELAISLARASADFVPTMLLLEGLARFDRKRLSDWAERMNSADHSFQTLIVLPSDCTSLSEWQWTGWRAARLFRESGKTRIIQD